MQVEVTHIGQRIKELAREKNRSVKELADQTGMTSAGIYDTFKRTSITTKTIARFCEALGVPMNDILYRKVDQTSSVSPPTDYQIKYIQELEARVAEQSKLIAQLAQANQVLIERLGKPEASEWLAVQLRRLPMQHWFACPSPVPAIPA